MVGDGGNQILQPVWTSIGNNFGSGTVFWAIILLLDFAVAAYRYHKTREVSEFVKTLLLMVAITVVPGLIIQWAGGTS